MFNRSRLQIATTLDDTEQRMNKKWKVTTTKIKIIKSFSLFLSNCKRNVARTAVYNCYSWMALVDRKIRGKRGKKHTHKHTRNNRNQITVAVSANIYKYQFNDICTNSKCVYPRHIVHAVKIETTKTDQPHSQNTATTTTDCLQSICSCNRKTAYNCFVSWIGPFGNSFRWEWEKKRLEKLEKELWFSWEFNVHTVKW